MSAHTEACSESRSLCDRLLSQLRAKIPELERSSTQGSCGLFRRGWTRFAYVYHAKTQPQIEIWCRGDADDLQRHAGTLEVRPRVNLRAGWEAAFPARFRVDVADEITSAARALAEVSYHASRPVDRAA